MIIKVLGSGCKKCIKLEKRIKKVILQNKIDAEVEKVTDFQEIAKYNLLQTPGVVIDDVVVASGKLLEDDEILKLINDNK
jgi:small redox-active disulfide protein 2